MIIFSFRTINIYKFTKNKFNGYYFNCEFNMKIEVDITFTNSERKNEKFEIGEWYLQNNYYATIVRYKEA